MMKPTESDRQPAGRRKFLARGVAGMAIASTSHVVLARDGVRVESESHELARDLTTNVDVVVVGGGTAGTIAAIQAGRAGAKTLLIERSGQLGGMTTVGGVCYPGLFDAWGKQIIDGIGWELVKESVELDGGRLPDFAKVPQAHWQNQVTVNQHVYSILAEEKCADAGVEMAYHEFIQNAKAVPAGWELTCVGFGTNRVVRCKQIVDCTGGAEVVGLLGYERMREEETQPGSYFFQLGGNYEVGRKQLHQIYVHGADSTNSRTVTEAKLAGRKLVLKKLREAGGRPQPLKPGTVPTVPLSALVPKDSRNIIVAGRCISSDRLANSGLRVQAACMAMGQAAAGAAALAAKDGTTPGKVPLGQLHTLLKEHAAIIPQTS